MTQSELAAKFTPPDPNLVKARQAILNRIETLIRNFNTRGMADEARGLARAAYIVRDIIDSEGKIFLDDIKDFS